MSTPDTEQHLNKNDSLSNSNKNDMENWVLFSTGLVYNLVMPLGALSIITRLFLLPVYTEVIYPAFLSLIRSQGLTGLIAGVLIIVVPAILITIALLQNKARKLALALSILTTLNMLIGLFLAAMLLVAMIP